MTVKGKGFCTGVFRIPKPSDLKGQRRPREGCENAPRRLQTLWIPPLETYLHFVFCEQMQQFHRLTARRLPKDTTILTSLLPTGCSRMLSPLHQTGNTTDTGNCPALRCSTQFHLLISVCFPGCSEIADCPPAIAPCRPVQCDAPSGSGEGLARSCHRCRIGPCATALQRERLLESFDVLLAASFLSVGESPTTPTADRSASSRAVVPQRHHM